MTQSGLRKTEILRSFYSGLDSPTTPFNYRILRAGHIRTAPEYRISRNNVPGHEFIFCLGGVGHVRFHNKVHRVEKNMLAWLPVQVPHAHYPDPDQPWEILWVRIESANLNQLLTILSVESEPVFRFANPDEVRLLIEACLTQIQQHSLLAAAAGETLAASLIERLLQSRSTQLLEPQAASHKGLARLMKEIHLHYNDAWDVDRLCEICGVSKSHLFCLFKSAFGQTPHTWLRSYRIAHAKRLLVETDDPIASIAHQVGYEDPLYFSRDFRMGVGLSPSEFRRSMR
ncbi:helix-turn-helix transcriptional regulator [Rhizobium wenxiniae]|uniref:helix-turn-helix transcriptional regulator n=1 Tax=Rhizobium wenxiniae TaxID=1737357 RepID=UPI001C6EFCCB|nr:AraC family transcriptional regulator [Rhizobium wenxiniae]MBW9088645.1 helix-turn-helix transcriptional regulator [Rhizobium wenxiniae]